MNNFVQSVKDFLAKPAGKYTAFGLVGAAAVVWFVSKKVSPGTVKNITAKAVDSTVGELVETVSGAITQRSALGVRLNNPGCVRYDVANQWLGQIGQENGFCKFSDMKYGIRVVMYLLRRYMTVNGLVSVRQIVERYAPRFENNTTAYIDFVVQQTGFAPDGQLTANQPTISKLTAAICRNESNVSLTANQLAEAWQIL